MSPQLKQNFESQPMPRAPSFRWLKILLSVLLVLVIALVGFIAYSAYIVFTLPERMVTQARSQTEATFRDLRLLGEEASNRIRAALNFSPSVMVDDRVIVSGFANVAHLVLHEVEFTQQRQFTHTFIGSTKRLEIHGVFRSRAGIDLAKESKIEISNRGILVTLPPPEVLTVELKDISFVQDSDGIWNRIRPDEREQHVNQLVSRARESAKELHARHDLEKRAREMLLEILTPLTEAQITIVFSQEVVERKSENPLSIDPLRDEKR